MKCGVMRKMIKVTPYENKMNTFIRRLPKVQETNHKLTQLRGLVKDELSQKNLQKSLEADQEKNNKEDWNIPLQLPSF